MRMIRHLAVLGLALAAVAGCTIEKKAAARLNDDTHVSGTVMERINRPPGEGGMTLTVDTGSGGPTETVNVPSLFDGSAPTSVELALQQQADAVKVGDAITATGTRDATRQLVAERLEILER